MNEKHLWSLANRSAIAVAIGSIKAINAQPSCCAR